MRPGECRREAGAAVARGRVRLCWKLLQCGQLRVGTGVRVGGAAESRRPVSLSVPGPTLRDCRPAFGCCALSLQLFPSGSFLGGPWGGLGLRSGLENPPRGRGAGPGLMRRRGALFAGQGLAPRGPAGVARGGGREARTAGRCRLGDLGANWAGTPARGVFGTEVSSSGQP